LELTKGTLIVHVFDHPDSRTGHGEAAVPCRAVPDRTGPDRPRDPLRLAAGVSSGCSSKSGDLQVRPRFLFCFNFVVIYNSTQKHFSLFDSGMETKQECPPKLIETFEDGESDPKHCLSPV
ncbi:unnamed protein product, partial [Musa textilis]